MLTSAEFQVLEVINRKHGLRKISFISHSVGGLVARYAIGKLYKPQTKESGEELLTNEESKGTIAGLEPVNFITAATPHLGSRGNKQVILYLLIAFVYLWYLYDGNHFNGWRCVAVSIVVGFSVREWLSYAEQPFYC